MTTLGDVLGYLTYANPVSQAVINTTVGASKGTYNWMKGSGSPPPPPVILPLWKYAGSNYNFVRLAGISGAAAIMISVYGKAHMAALNLNPKDEAEALAIFDTANRFHFVHSCALFAVPLAHHPLLTGSLMTIGTLLLSGPMYYRALTGKRTLVHMAVCGGFCVFGAWLSLIF